MAALSVAGWFVQPIVEKIINSCFDYLGKQTGMEEVLERLQYNHPKIQAVVFAANQAQITSDQNPALNKWIWKLRDALDEVNDVLDELEYIKHEEKLPKNMEETKLKSVMKTLDKFSERAFKRDPTLKRLEEAVKKLDKVSADVNNFLDLLRMAKEEQKEQEAAFLETRKTGPLPKNDLMGRGKDKESVVQWLIRKPSNEHRGTDLHRNISLLSIVGHGGMGKTTLLQHVYKDEEITKEFDLKMWVCVSNNFDVKKVIADMLECLENERPRLETLGELQRRVQKKVMSKKFLLVLDDIWEEDDNGDISKWEDKWGNVLASLADGGFGSKIMVTTRTDSVALMFAKVIKKKEIVKLQGLEEDECLQLLISHAFVGVDPDDHKKLRVIAGEIVKKLLGSPLAAKVIGGLLNNNLDERRWRTILGSNLLGQNSVASILRLSYIALSNPLKSCFAFCCMFEQDHKYDKDDLIRMWIALGFIQPSQGQTFEDVGKSHFEDLVRKILLEKVGDDYKMHDLIHESASQFFAQEYGKFFGDEESSFKIPETIRHMFVATTNPNIIKKIGKFKYLHSLFLFYEDSNEQDLCNALIEIFKASRSLRLLYTVVSENLKIIPEEIGNLIHLRYLRIDVDNLTMLPRSLSNLYHLQYIIDDGFKWRESEDDFLPSDINNLSNLRYVKLSENCILSIFGIGKLKSLQNLHKFKLRDASGYRIGELENMNDLCKLRIKCLENVKDAEEACSAKLYDKKRLTDLTLRWSTTDSRNIDLNQNVLDNLEPPECLRNLSIKRYMGSRSAIWMNKVNPIFNLEKIKLEDCLELETLPPFGQLPFLKSLKLFGMPKVKWLECKFNGNDKYCAFPSLEKLCIEELEALEDWFEAGVAAEDDGCLFPSLIKLDLIRCPKLKELPSLPHKLKSLIIRNTGWTALNFCSNSNPIPLETLDVYGCPNITSLPLADEIARLPALIRHLKIKNCPNISDIHLADESLQISDPSVLLMEPLRSIASLKRLTIEDNDEVVSFPNEAVQWFLKFGSSLSELLFWRLKSLESLPSSLESLSSLRVLHIKDLPMLRELPNFPPSLESLYIWGCLNITFLPNFPPSLESLYIWECLNITFLPNFPPSLESLYIWGCLNITSLPLADEIARLPALIRHMEIDNCPNISYIHLADESLQISDPSVLLMEPLRGIASLKKLTIEKNDEVVSFPNEAVQWFLKFGSSLYELEFKSLKSLESLPSSLESLSSLELLHIEDVPMLRELPNLPPSLERLYIEGCRNITSLPLADEIARLAALRHLTIMDCPNLISLGARLPALRRLFIYNCPNISYIHLADESLQISDPSVLLMEPLRSIASLNKLRISSNDEVVSFPNEVEQWFLNVRSSLSELDFSHLKSLESLPFSLESLSSLRVLRIEDVPMLRELSNLPASLERLYIEGCRNITSLPLSDEIVGLPALRYFEIKNCSNISYIHLADESLQIGDPSVLLMEPLRSIASLKKLTISSNDEVVSFPNEAVQWFLKFGSSLSELLFWRLKSLESLPSSLESLSSLQKLLVWDVPMLRELPNLPASLESLYISGCLNITSLPMANEIARLAALRKLKITKCPNVRSLGNYPEVGTSNNYHLIIDHLWISDPSVLLMEPLRSIASLKKLTIEDNNEVVSFPNEAEQWFLNVSSSLSDLEFWQLKSLESLPSSLESLSSLQNLYIQHVPMLRELPNLPPNLQKLNIRDVPMLRELPNLPPNLQHLIIWGCDPELKERYGEDGGSHRHKIAHIPKIEIST